MAMERKSESALQVHPGRIVFGFCMLTGYRRERKRSLFDYKHGPNFLTNLLLALRTYQAERKRLRNGKKAARRKARKHKHADEKLISKLQPGLGLNNPYEKRKLREELQMARASGKYDVASENKALYNDEAAESKEYQTSTKFFAKMQENVETLVRDGDEDGGQAKKKRKGLEAGQGSSVYRL